MRHQSFNHSAENLGNFANDAENQRVCGRREGRGTHAPARFEFTCIRSRVVGSYAHTHTHAPVSSRNDEGAEVLSTGTVRTSVAHEIASGPLSFPLAHFVQSRPFPLTPPTVISVIRYPHLGPGWWGQSDFRVFFPAKRPTCYLFVNTCRTPLVRGS